WSIPSEDPYEEAAQQLFEQALHSPEYVPRDHVPVFVPKFEHPEDLVPAEYEAPASLLPPGFLSPRIRPLSLRALRAEMNAIASSLYHSLHPSRTPPLLPIPLSTPSTGRRAGILEADTPPRNRPLISTPRPGCEVGESFATAARRPGPTMAHGKDRTTVRAEIEVLRSERLAYDVRLQMILLFSILCVPRLWRLEHAMKPWRTLVAVPRFGYDSLLRNSSGEDGSHSSHAENPRNMHNARPCYYADFMKCHPLNFKGTEGAVGLTCWIEKMESVFNISGCTVENQSVLKKKMTDKYCPFGEVKKLGIELWNLKVRDNDIPTYTNRFPK
nr:hypothetical protein [Tanacetum cinerariifolium]